MKKYTYTIDNKSNNTFSINTKTGSDYSKILDDLIHADIMDKNYYLNGTTTGDIYLDKMIGIKNSNPGLKDADAFTKAANFLANYGNNTKKYKFPYEYGKTYTLSDGTPIIFFDDSIQIGFDLYYFDDFKKPIFLNNLGKNIKNTIISIYIDGLKISIIK